MTLYLAAGALAVLAIALLGPASTALARARWVDRAPRSGIALWQALGASALLAGIGSGLCVAVERYGRGFTGGLAALTSSITTGHPLTGLGLPDALGLTLAADLAVVLVSMVGYVTLSTAVSRARHRRLVDLLSLRELDTGASVLDHAAPVAYCVPGIRPRIVVSAGALALLDDAQLEAVIAHERGHANERHGLVMMPLMGISKVLTFIPYARLAPQSVAGLLEMAADDYAVRRIDRLALVSALVSMATAGAPPRCAFGLTAGWVSRRVDRLLKGPTDSRRLVGVVAAAAVGLVLLPAAILLAS
jgi:Zn-dependent protease with chaperone function